MIRKESALILRPNRSAQLLAGREGLLLVGEAAGWISPSSAEGLSYAFTSAAMAAKALSEGLASSAECYSRLTAPLKRTILLKNIKVPFIYIPPLRRPVTACGLSSTEVDS